jgi:hypothetical protein
VVECGGEQADDVLRPVREVVADAAHAAVVGDHAATVAVDQAEDQFFGGLVDECFLPWLEPDRPAVLSTGAVLGEKAGSVLGILSDLYAAGWFPHDRRMLAGITASMASQQRLMIAGYFKSSTILRRHTRRTREMQPSPR